MRIRWKFFLTLLAFSLIPLGIMAMFDHQHLSLLGRKIGSGLRKGMTEIVSEDLLQSAQSQATLLARTKSAINFASNVLAREMEIILSGNTALLFPRGSAGPAASAATPHFAEEFDHPADTTPAKTAPGYYRNEGTGQVPQRVSFDLPTYYIPPGADRAAALRDVALISPLAGSLKNMLREFGSNLHWVQVTLESGLHMSFPGHGGYPKDYDPRSRPWYLNAKEAFADKDRGTVWSGPMRDATSGLAVFAASRPVIGPDGTFAGAVSLDMPLSGVLGQDGPVSKWSGLAKTFLAYADADPKTGGLGLVILAQGAYEKRVSSWTASIAYDWLRSDDPKAFGQLLESMNQSPSGIMNLPYDGEDSVWTYATVEEGLFFVIIAPKKAAMAMANQADDAIAGAVRSLYQVSSASVLLVILAVTAVAFVSAKRFTKPMDALVTAWKRLAGGDFSVRLDIKARDERDVLVRSFNETVPKLADYVRLSQSMELAQEVQRNLLPAKAPDIPGLDVDGVSLYCDETGGDYFDYFTSQWDGKQAFTAVIGDVTGHGAAPALLMATARALFQCAAEDPGGPAERVSRANRLLCRDVGDSGRFMTLYWLELSPDLRLARWVRAGHDPALLVDPREGRTEELMGNGIPLGVVSGYPYKTFTHDLDIPGAVLALGTDGIWEARNPAGEMYGKERFYAVIRENAVKTAKEIREAVLSSLYAFMDGAPQEDDVTLVVIKKTTPA